MSRLAPLLAVALVAVAAVADATARESVPDPAWSAIRLASLTYSVPRSEMTAVARCETGGTFAASSYNHRSGAAGLFQFLPSTWRRTPYSTVSPFDAYASALAAAWLVRKDGGWGEWTCRP